MNENAGDQSQSPPVNQSTQTVQTPPPTVTQPPVQAEQAAAVPQQPAAPQQPVGDKKPKSKKKVFGALIAFIVLIVAGLIALSIPTVKGLTACMQQNSKDLELLTQKGTEEKWSKEKKCIETKPIIEKTATCYDNVGSKNIIPARLVFTLSGLFNSSAGNVDKESIIALHNSSCSDYPAALIGKEAQITVTQTPEVTKTDKYSLYNSFDIPSEEVSYPVEWPEDLHYPEELKLVYARGSAEAGWEAALTYSGTAKEASDILEKYFISKGWEVTDRTIQDDDNFGFFIGRNGKEGAIIIGSDPSTKTVKMLTTVYE